MGELSRRRLTLMRQVLLGLDAQGWERVTSRDLGRWIGASPDTVRKDLAGTADGQPGAAYDVAALLRRLDSLVPPEPIRKTVLAGLGDLGVALATANGPWTFLAGFDARTNRLEQLDLPFPLHPTTEIVAVCQRWGVDSAVLALASQEVQKVAERFVLAGVRHLVNYSPTVLRVDRNKIEVWELGGAV